MHKNQTNKKILKHHHHCLETGKKKVELLREHVFIYLHLYTSIQKHKKLHAINIFKASSFISAVRLNL